MKLGRIEADSLIDEIEAFVNTLIEVREQAIKDGYRSEGTERMYYEARARLMNAITED